MESELTGDVVELAGGARARRAGRPTTSCRWCARSRGSPPSRSPTRRTSSAASGSSRSSWPGSSARRCSASSDRRAAASRRSCAPGCCPPWRAACCRAASDWAQIGHPARESIRCASWTALRRAPTAPFVLAVDQFEEVFTACRDERERAAFIAELARLAPARAGRRGARDARRLLRALRARTRSWRELLAANHVLVGAMRRDELRRAVECPARRVGLRRRARAHRCAGGDVEDELGALPLLSAALLELWQRRDGRRLRLRRLRADRAACAARSPASPRTRSPSSTGAPAGRRAQRADEARRARSDEGAVERRSVPLAELEQSEDVARVLALLTDSRLLTVGAGRSSSRTRRCCASGRGCADGSTRIARICGSSGASSAAAREWRRLDRDEGALYRGVRLTEAMRWRARQRRAAWASSSASSWRPAR